MEAHFKGVRLDEISRPLVEAWMTSLGAEGVGVEYASKLLIQLRFVCSSVGNAGQHADYPWRRVAPVPPAKPNTAPNDPVKWGGKPNSKPPALSFLRGLMLATMMRASHRMVVYLMLFMGLRRGEVMGLRLRHFSRKDGWLVVAIREQRDLNTGEVKEWVKADASYRDLPIPPILAAFIERYILRYHSGDRVDIPEAEPGLRHLVVTSTGRDVNGGFMAASVTAPVNEWNKVRDNNGYSFKEVGYRLRPHFLRASLSTYLLNAGHVCAQIELPEEGRLDASSNDVTELQALVALLLGQRQWYLSGAVVSAWLGQENENVDDEHGAAAASVTMEHYNLGFNDEFSEFTRIARVLERILRHEIGVLEDEPDETDLRRVIRADDPDWVLLSAAAAEIGIAAVSVSDAIRRGSYEGELVWFADGDRNVPGPRLVLPRHEVDRVVRRKGLLTRTAAEKATGFGHGFIMARVAAGELSVADTHQGRPYFDEQEVRRFLATYHGAVTAVLTRSGALTPKRIRDELARLHAPTGMAKHQMRPEGELFGRTGWPHLAHVQLWLTQLLDSKQVERLRNGTYRFLDSSDAVGTVDIAD
jgi:integrase